VRYLENRPDFVAAFPQTNSGDMSPNLNLKPGSGPTENELENTRIIGDRQFTAAKTAYDNANTGITGDVDYRMSYVDMENVAAEPRFSPDGRPRRTCPAAIGASTLVGSIEDGPGIPIIPEGVTNPITELLKPLKIDVPPWLISCQSPKLAVVPSGLANDVLPFTPRYLPLQIVRIGQFHLVAGPAEFTIVSGLRVTTPEEYQLQQYEGGSTLYGKYTLPACRQSYAKLATALQPGVVFDSAPRGKQFGDVLTQPAASYRAGERATVEFVTGPPEEQPAPQRHVPRGATAGGRRMAAGARRRRLADDLQVDPRRARRLEGDDHVGHPRGDAVGHLPGRAPRRLEARNHAGDHRVHRHLARVHGAWMSTVRR
jgi:neutral ceramidase